MTPDEIALYGPPLHNRSNSTTTATHRRCNVCKQWRNYLEFFKNKSHYPAIDYTCKKCISKKYKQKRQKKYEKIESLYGPPIFGSHGKITGTHKFCPNCKQWKKHDCFGKDRNNAFGFKCRCRDCCSITDRERRYNISLDTYKQMFDDQNGQCAICGAAEGNSKHKNLYIDHDHKTGEVRGLLCHCCNNMLGYSKDTPDILRQGATYLERTCK